MKKFVQLDEEAEFRGADDQGVEIFADAVAP